MLGAARFIWQYADSARPIWHLLFLRRDLGSPLDKDAWADFQQASESMLAPRTAWQKWDDPFQDGTACSRYFGDGKQKVLDEVLGALKSVGRVLREYEAYDFDELVKWNLPRTGHPQRRFRGESLPDPHRMVELITCQMGKRVTGRVSPLAEAGFELLLVEDFCSAAAEAIESWVTQPHAVVVEESGPQAVPKWNGHILTFDGKTIKRYKQPADAQKQVLWAFQHKGWREVITDPLDAIPGYGPEEHRKRMRDTVYQLNQRHVTQGLIRFEAVGGEAIRWHRGH